jgi:hypothetical protein
MAPPPDYYWVTWTRTGDETAARKSALIWGPQPDPPPQLSDKFLAGPFRTKQAAQAYEDAIGKNTLIPPPGTPVVGNVQVPNPLSGLAAIGAALAKAVGYLSDLSMWRSLGWLLLGAVLIILGIVLWLKKENFLPSVVPLPV